MNEISILQKEIDKLKKSIKKKRFGLVWMDIPEAFEEEAESKIPILKEIHDCNVKTENSNDTHLLIEGDNYHALTCLNYTHKNKVDVIYIDPPYNTGSDGFKYKDKRVLDKFPDGVEVPKDHPFRHSYWLSFMYKRLELAKNLLSEKGIIIVHIDENELFNLIHVMNEIYGTENDLGTIIWNKKNPKGDSKGVSTMHEYVLCYAKNKSEFLNQGGTLKRRKPNAVSILKKAKSLYVKNGKTLIPDEIKEVIKPFNYNKEKLKDFEVKYDLAVINKEFQNWLRRQDFSNGEKAYRYIDGNGDVYRGVSMAWPNKDKAPDEYYKPLIHPTTGKPCPVPSRGWRNSPKTMEKLLGDNKILFGSDETKQPERKYLLKENMLENTPSIYEYAGSDDKYFSKEDLVFPYAKPIDVAKYFLTSIHPNPNIILDFFAGSGTTAHAVIELNDEFNKNMQFILVSNNENEIMTNVCFPRVKSVIESSSKNSLKYYITDFVGKHDINNISDEDRLNLALNAGELLAVAEETYEFKLGSDYYQIYEGPNKITAIYFRESYIKIDEFIMELKEYNKDITIYIYSWSNNLYLEEFDVLNKANIKYIPEPILEIYKQIYNLGGN